MNPVIKNRSSWDTLQLLVRRTDVACSHLVSEYSKQVIKFARSLHNATHGSNTGMSSSSNDSGGRNGGTSHRPFHQDRGYWIENLTRQQNNLDRSLSLYYTLIHLLIIYPRSLTGQDDLEDVIIMEIDTLSPQYPPFPTISQHSQSTSLTSSSSSSSQLPSNTPQPLSTMQLSIIRRSISSFNDLYTESHRLRTQISSLMARYPTPSSTSTSTPSSTSTSTSTPSQNSRNIEHTSDNIDNTINLINNDAILLLDDVTNNTTDDDISDPLSLHSKPNNGNNTTNNTSLHSQSMHNLYHQQTLLQNSLYATSSSLDYAMLSNNSITRQHDVMSRILNQLNVLHVALPSFGQLVDTIQRHRMRDTIVLSALIAFLMMFTVVYVLTFR